MAIVPRTPEQAETLIGQLGGVLTDTHRRWSGLFVVCGFTVHANDSNSVEFLLVHPHGKPDEVKPILPGWFYATHPDALRFVDRERN